MLDVPSGQQGQGFESSVCGIESAHGISAVPALAPLPMADAIGADRSACPATSTYIRVRIRRRFTRLNIGFLGSDRQLSASFPSQMLEGRHMGYPTPGLWRSRKAHHGVETASLLAIPYPPCQSISTRLTIERNFRSMRQREDRDRCRLRSIYALAAGKGILVRRRAIGLGQLSAQIPGLEARHRLRISEQNWLRTLDAATGDRA